MSCRDIRVRATRPETDLDARWIRSAHGASLKFTHNSSWAGPSALRAAREGDFFPGPKGPGNGRPPSGREERFERPPSEREECFDRPPSGREKRFDRLPSGREDSRGDRAPSARKDLGRDRLPSVRGVPYLARRALGCCQGLQSLECGPLLLLFRPEGERTPLGTAAHSKIVGKPNTRSKNRPRGLGDPTLGKNGTTPPGSSWAANRDPGVSRRSTPGYSR